MKPIRLHLFLLWVFLCFFYGVASLKCRTATESQQNNDFEYVVRMCLRHIKNESDIYNFYSAQNNYESGKNKRHRDEMSGDYNNNENRNYYYGRNRGYPEGFDRFWPSGNAPHDRNGYNDDGDFEESDYFGFPKNSKDGRKKYKGRPHSYQQQLQHDRDVLYSRGNREPNYFHTNRNKNTKLLYNKEKNNNSPLNDIEPCVIHCIFQEMQMVDDKGKPNKELISQKMTQKIRNSELKNFIQESVEECFDAIDDEEVGMSRGGSNSNNNRYRKPEMMCEWAKTFAVCLEDRGRENCDDWNEPVQKNHNNNNNNNTGGNKNAEDQRHKSKQNEREFALLKAEESESGTEEERVKLYMKRAAGLKSRGASSSWKNPPKRRT